MVTGPTERRRFWGYTHEERSVNIGRALGLLLVIGVPLFMILKGALT